MPREYGTIVTSQASLGGSKGGHQQLQTPLSSIRYLSHLKSGATIAAHKRQVDWCGDVRLYSRLIQIEADPVKSMECN